MPATDSLKLLIHGANGRMGRALLRLADQSSLQVIAAVSSGSPAQRVIDGVARFSADELGTVPAFDVAIDFSLPTGLEAVLALCVERGAALVSGTTGLTDTQRESLTLAAGTIPLVWSSNYSLGVAVLETLVERAAATLPGWDCDIVEAHHARKVDAPSGTALSLGEAALRNGAQPRYASLRAGDIVGEHTVQFTAAGERIELIHRAGDRDIFARGALHAAARLPALGAGLHRFRDLV